MKYYLDRNGDLRCEELSNSEVIWRNFSGINRTKYPNPDNKSFSVVIKDKDFAQELIAEGWPIRIYTPKVEYDPDVEPFYHLPVKVKFNDRYGKPLRRQPEIYIYSNGTRSQMGEEYCTAMAGDEASMMDRTYFESIILDINMGVNKETGKATAYLRRFDGKLPVNLSDQATAAWVTTEE